MTHRVAASALSIVAVMLAAAQPRLDGQTAPEFQLAQGKAGRLEVGMPVDEVYRLVGRDRTQLIDLQLEGMFEPALEIRFQGAPVQPAIIVRVREWPCAWSVQGIDVRDPRFRTAEGVGVGSTLAEVARHYKVTLSREEGPHAWADAVRMNFRLDDAALKPTAKVTSVWLPGDPVAVRKARCPERGALGR